MATALVILFLILFLVFAYSWCHAQSEVIAKEEDKRAAEANLATTQSKAERVIKDALLLQSFFSSHAARPSGSLENRQIAVAPGFEEMFLNVQRFKQVMACIVKEADDVQYSREILNHRIAAMNTTIRSPLLTGLAASAMGKDVEPLVDTAVEKPLTQLLEGAAQDVAPLEGRVDIDDLQKVPDQLPGGIGGERS